MSTRPMLAGHHAVQSRDSLLVGPGFGGVRWRRGAACSTPGEILVTAALQDVEALGACVDMSAGTWVHSRNILHIVVS